MLKISVTVLTAMTLIAVHEVGDRYTNPQAYVYAREKQADAHTAKVLTMDEARRLASNIAKLPTLLSRRENKEK